MKRENILAQDKDHLKTLIKEEINLHGNECDLNHIDVSNITDMSYLFEETNFDGNISQWDVSNVINMKGMFIYSEFNGDLSKWDVSQVNDMSSMFKNSDFNNESICRWNVTSVNTMQAMFYNSSFNKDISKWDVSNLVFIDYIFYYSKFNKSLDNWKPFNLKCSIQLTTLDSKNFKLPYWGNLTSNNEIKQKIMIREKEEMLKNMNNNSFIKNTKIKL